MCHGGWLTVSWLGLLRRDTWGWLPEMFHRTIYIDCIVGCIRVFQRNTANRRYYMYIKYRNRLMQLWRLTRPTMCQERLCSNSFWVWRPENWDGGVGGWGRRSESMSESRYLSSSREGECACAPPFGSVQVLSVLDDAHAGEGTLFLLSLTPVLISFGDIFVDIPRIVLLAILASPSPVKLT